MFIFDKDMERIMVAKKKELLAQIEEAKKRVLEELYCVKREVHTDFCEMLADYNRIDFTLKKLVADLKQEVKDCVDTYKNILAEQIVNFNQQIDTKINVFEQYVIESIATLENALTELETMQNTVNNAIVRLNELLSNSVTREELEQAIANIDVTEELEQLATELRTEIANAGVQSDWNETDETSKAFIKNKTHAMNADVVCVQVSTDYDMNGSYRIPFHIGANVRPVSVEAIIDGKVVSIPYTGKSNCIVYELVNSYWLKRGGIFDIYGDVQYEAGTPYADTIAAYIVGEYLYITIDVNYNSKTLRASMTGMASLDLFAYANESVQLLDAKFLANNPAPNSFLRYVGGTCEWTSELFKPVETVEIITVFDGMAKFDKEDDGYIYFTLGDCGDAPFESHSIPHSVRVGTLQLGYSSNGSAEYGTNTKARFYVNTNGILTCQLNKNNVAHVGDYQNEGAYILIQRQGNVTYETLIELYSPNGTKYRLSVSDDGTLSATPVTT